MSKALKKQVCYALGTLGGWGLARATKAKETVPFTILGGLVGFAVSENLFGADDGKVIVKPYASEKKKDDEQLNGTRRKRRKPVVSLVHSPAFTDAELRAMKPKKRPKRRKSRR